MSIQLKLRRGTTAQHSTFTGASGEVTVDTDKKTLVVHDGATPGGVPVLSAVAAAVGTTNLADGSVTAPKLAAGAASVVGEIKMWPTSSAPTGYLLCNGTAVSRSTYAALFALFGTTFGAGDGSSTFNLPDFRDRMPTGAGTTYSANSKGGSADAVIPSHTHTATSTVTDPGHSHIADTGSSNGGQTLFGRYSLGTAGTLNTRSATTGITVGTSVSSTGVSATGANLPPYIGIYFIIKS